MAITSWTSAGSWTSPTDEVWKYAEAVRLALKERCTAAKYTVPTAFAPALADGVISKDAPFSIAFANAVQYVVNALIPLYVNHTDNGGAWDGVAESAFAPYWTEAGLLAAIGTGVTRRAVTGFPEWAWFAQQRQIVDLLRWTRVSLFGQSYNNYYGNCWNADPEAAKATAEANYMELSIGGGKAAYCVLYLSGGLYFAETSSGRHRHYTENLSTTMAHTVDFYNLITRKMHSGVDEFSKQGRAVGDENEVWLAESVGPTTDAAVYCAPIGGTEMPVDWPDAPSTEGGQATRGFRAAAFSYASRSAVGKWNVTGGFAFAP